MKKVLMLLGIISSLFITPVYAEGIPSYIGLQAGKADVEGDDLGYNLLRLGIRTSENLTVEIRGGVGTDDTVVDGVTVEIERMAGIYGSYHHYFTENVSAYGIGGWSKITLKGSLNGASDQPDENGLSYGAGVEAYGVNIEWIRYLDTNDLEVDALAIGYNYHFK